MPRVCTICSHIQREAIDKALVAGGNYRDLSALYRVSEDAILRHKTNHLAAAMVQAQGASEAAHAENLLDQLKNLQSTTLSVLSQAQQAQDLRVVAALIGQARGNLELLFKLTGELAQEGTVNIVVLPEWITVRTAMLQALAPYPEARLAVAAALERVDHDH